VDAGLERNISKFDEWIVDGTYLRPASEQDRTYGIIPCLIGAANARKFEVGVGDTIVLSIGNARSSTTSVRAKIQGIFQSIAEPVDKYTVLVHRKDLSRMFNETENQLSYTVFLAKNRRLANRLKRELETRKGGLSAEFLTYEELQPGITKLLEFSDSMMVVFYAIILLGFGIVLMNSILMSVFERTREIGIILALGSSDELILGMIVFESLLLGLLGSMAGIAAGGAVILVLGQTGFSFTMFSKGMELMGGAGTMMYPSLKFADLAWGLYIVIIICILASLYPVMRATIMSPIKAIYSR